MCIAAPQTSEADAFIKFIEEELAPRKVNTLILCVDYDYQKESHPELRNESALSKAGVKKLADVYWANHGLILRPKNRFKGTCKYTSELFQSNVWRD